ncbi:hypothetical protein AB1L42_04330 [Thalassoglobus sp. JC818]|uniref:hypothetical protein n=1 Tax=Thalassoglobus sp. JC818 TaxID=3232136 RepID=UPI00345AF0CA
MQFRIVADEKSQVGDSTTPPLQVDFFETQWPNQLVLKPDLKEVAWFPLPGLEICETKESAIRSGQITAEFFFYNQRLYRQLPSSDIVEVLIVQGPDGIIGDIVGASPIVAKDFTGDPLQTSLWIWFVAAFEVNDRWYFRIGHSNSDGSNLMAQFTEPRKEHKETVETWLRENYGEGVIEQEK